MSKTTGQPIINTAHQLPHRRDHVAISAAIVDGESHGGSVQCDTEAKAAALVELLRRGRFDAETGRVWLDGDMLDEIKAHVMAYPAAGSTAKGVAKQREIEVASELFDLLGDIRMGRDVDGDCMPLPGGIRLEIAELVAGWVAKREKGRG